VKPNRITSVLAFLAILAIALGFPADMAQASSHKSDAKGKTAIEKAVLKVLDGYHAAMKAGDVEKVMAAISENYSNSQGTNKAELRMFIAGAAAQGAFSGLSANLEECKVAVEGDVAVARPVIYDAATAYVYKVKRESDGVWRIVNNEQIASPLPAVKVGPDAVKLPAPKMSGGRPLMDVLKDRQSMRSYRKDKLPDQVLSNLLWAAWGINRKDRGLHTAPSSSNQQEIDVYVALEKGLYLYEPRAHVLYPVLDQDLRAASGTQRFVGDVPLNLIYVADHARMYRGSGMDDNMKFAISSANSGFIAQNVYLFCASEGLGTVVRGLVPKESLARKMKLRSDQVIIYAQSVGYPR